MHEIVRVRATSAGFIPDVLISIDYAYATVRLETVEVYSFDEFSDYSFP